MDEISSLSLIEKATAVINARNVDEYNQVGQVGAALVTDKGNIFTGVCIDAGSGMGFCAEASAIAAMVTAGEMKIKKIVATWKRTLEKKAVVITVKPFAKLSKSQLHSISLASDNYGKFLGLPAVVNTS